MVLQWAAANTCSSCCWTRSHHLPRCSSHHQGGAPPYRSKFLAACSFLRVISVKVLRRLSLLILIGGFLHVKPPCGFLHKTIREVLGADKIFLFTGNLSY